MKSNIIRSEIYLKRRPVLAFFLSFFFTGLGQVYNGNFSKGLIFSVLRLFSLLIIPLYIFINGKEFSVFFLVPVLAVHLLIWIISPFEALYSALKRDFFNLHWFNSVIIYFLYAIVLSFLLVLSCMMVPKLFSIEKINTENMNPGLLKDEYVLVNKFNAKNADIADIVYFSYGAETASGRIVAKQGDIVEVRGNSIIINDNPLSYNVFNEKDAERMNITDFHEVFFEINNEKKYPVILGPERTDKDTIKKHFIIGDNEILIAYDKRIGDEVFIKTGLDTITGIVQGIIYSKNIEKILNRSYLPDN